MRVLIACEESQTVCKAFRALGHEAYSCDIIECSGGHPEWHLQQDVLPLLKIKWDLIIAHPPCTYMSKAGARWMYPKAGVLSEERYQQAMEAKDFFMQFYNCSCEHIAIENPVPLKVVNLPPPRRKSSPTSSASLTARQRSFGSKDYPSCSRRKYSWSIRLGCHRTREVSLAERVAAVASLTTLARQVRLSTASPRQWPSNGRYISKRMASPNMPFPHPLQTTILKTAPNQNP